MEGNLKVELEKRFHIYEDMLRTLYPPPEGDNNDTPYKNAIQDMNHYLTMGENRTLNIRKTRKNKNKNKIAPVNKYAWSAKNGKGNVGV